jgi:hypothetical protein
MLVSMKPPGVSISYSDGYMLFTIQYLGKRYKNDYTLFYHTRLLLPLCNWFNLHLWSPYKTTRTGKCVHA